MKDKTGCSLAFLGFMKGGKYFEAFGCAQAMLEEYGDVVRHHEMMLTANLRRKNIPAALDNCNELISYGRLKKLDVSEYESHREAIHLRLSLTRNYRAAGFWDEVAADPATAPQRYAGVPIVLTGEAHLQRNTETGNSFLTFFIRDRADMRIGCRLAPCETPFLKGLDFPHWSSVHGRFLSASDSLILLDPCHYTGAFDSPPQ